MTSRIAIGRKHFQMENLKESLKREKLMPLQEKSEMDENKLENTKMALGKDLDK